jgi:Tol biopolymer transport system component
MTPRWVAAALTAGLMVVGAASPQTQGSTAEALFREALAKERAEGTLKDAVFGYERIIAEYPADRQAAGKAMFQLALIYEKLGDPRATVLLNRLVRDYSGVEPVAGRAKAKLKARQAEPPAPFVSVSLDENYELGSPDGRLVVYHKSADEWGQLSVMDLVARKERLLIDAPGSSVSNLAWSPDSRKLAYNFGSADNTVNEVRIADVATGESLTVGTMGYPTAWTATGDILFYRPNYRAGTVEWWLVTASGGQPRQVLSAPFGEGTSPVAMTPDGTRLIVSKAKKLFVQDLRSGQTTALTDGTWEESRPQVSTDGRLVAFQANPDGRWGMFVAALDGQLPVNRTVWLAALDEPTMQWAGWAGRTWWTDAGLLTYRLEYSRSNLYRVEMNPRTGKPLDRPVRLTQDAVDNLIPAVSPDNRRIAYWARNGTKSSLAVMDASGIAERPLVEQSLILGLFWRTPNELLYRRAKPGESSAMPVVGLNLDTGLEQEIARPEGVYWWYVPERREILHLYPKAGGAREGAELKAWSLADGKDRVVARIDFLLSVLAPSQDGRRIAYATYRPVPGSSRREMELGVLSTDSGSREVLVPAQTEKLLAPMVWSPDGRFLLYTTDAKGAEGMHIMDVASRESWPLCPDAADKEFGKRLDNHVAWSPNGTFVVVGRREPEQYQRLAWAGVTAEAVAKLMRSK